MAPRATPARRLRPQPVASAGGVATGPVWSSYLGRRAVVEFIQPPRELRQKTGKGVPGAGLRAVRSAEDAFKRHQDRVDYRSIAQPSLDRLSDLLSHLIFEPGDAEAARQAYEIAHNLRGEGGSSGYPAVSQAAAAS